MKNYNEYRVARTMVFFVSMSCVLQIAESLIPHPLAGLRLGLANTLTLIALVMFGLRYAFQISLIRTVLSSLVMGTFMSPAFFLSFFSAIVSVFVMWVFFRLLGGNDKYRLSIVGVSIIGALAHNTVQLFLAYYLLIKHKGIFLFLPWLSIGAVITGWITGLIAKKVCSSLRDINYDNIFLESAPCLGKPQPGVSLYIPGNSFLHQLPSEIKIACIVILSLWVLFFQSYMLYCGLLLSITAVIISAGISFSDLFRRIKKYWLFIATAFILPLFLNSGVGLVWQIGILKINRLGLYTGGIFALRILFLLITSLLLGISTSAEDLTRGIIKVISPFRFLGFSCEKTALILTLSWVNIPFLWEVTGKKIRAFNIRKASNILQIIPLFSGLIISLYNEAQDRCLSWDAEYAYLETTAGK